MSAKTIKILAKIYVYSHDACALCIDCSSFLYTSKRFNFWWSWYSVLTLNTKHNTINDKPIKNAVERMLANLFAAIDMFLLFWYWQTACTLHAEAGEPRCLAGHCEVKLQYHLFIKFIDKNKKWNDLISFNVIVSNSVKTVLYINVFSKELW